MISFIELVYKASILAGKELKILIKKFNWDELLDLEVSDTTNLMPKGYSLADLMSYKDSCYSDINEQENSISSISNPMPNL